MEEKENPWKILSEKPVYDNDWINITEYDVINPGGGKGIYGKVHFKNIAVGVLPLDENGDTYLVGQFRFTLNAYSWEMPEGGGLVAEGALAGAQRELLEETGLVAKEWIEIQTLHLSNSVTDEHSVLYLARQLEQQAAMPEQTEKLSIKKLPFEKVYQMVEDGAITDAMTVAAVLKIKLMILDGRI